jgi:hypothetical protein
LKTIDSPGSVHEIPVVVVVVAVAILAAVAGTREQG